jgi:lysyl-tRNA synthetase, class II
MSERKSEYQVRKEKLEQLRARGINPYAAQYDKTHAIQHIIDTVGESLRDVEQVIADPQIQVSIAWRVMLTRTHGAITFLRIQDETGIIQVMLHKNNCQLVAKDERKQEIGDISAYKFFEKMIDVGDFVGVKGEVFKTHKGELTVFAPEYTLLTKALRPLGDKRHGIGENAENAYRQRYLDMIFNRDVLERMQFRSKFTRTLREFYWAQGFTEVETPVLWNAASGAAAQPFVTHHNDHDLDVFLRIAPETALKMATVGWLEKVFEIAKNFRNEWSDPSHLQEFTAIEHYAVYWDYTKNMAFTEQLFDYIFDTLQLDRKINVKDKQWNIKQVDFTTPWARIDYIAQVKKDSGIDVSQYHPGDEEQLRTAIKEKWHNWVGLDEQTVATMIDYLYKKVSRPKLLGPLFIYNYPKTMQPLARVSDQNPNIVEQFQVVVNGREIIKAYSELVDPILQQQNFDDQAQAAANGDDEATKWDDQFVLSMEYGMPPQSGRGMGIDRIVTLLTQQDNLRDVILFPLMKPEHNPSSSWVEGDETKNLSNHKDSSLSSEWQVIYDNLPSTADAQALADKYLTETRKHCEQVGKIMQYFAKKLWQDTDARYIAGLLHDVDRDHIGKDPHKHLGEEFEKIVWEIDLSDQLISDIRSHYTEKTWVPVDLLIRKYLAAVDELSGLMYAYSLMRPEWFTGMETKSVMKKIKDKKFAAGVDRDHVRNCEKYLNISLEEFIPQMIEALTS